MQLLLMLEIHKCDDLLIIFLQVPCDKNWMYEK